MIISTTRLPGTEFLFFHWCVRFSPEVHFRFASNERWFWKKADLANHNIVDVWLVGVSHLKMKDE